MIEPGFQHGRGAAAIFGRAQHHDHVGRAGFVDGGLKADRMRDGGDLEGNACQAENSDSCQGDEERLFHALCWAFRTIVASHL